MKVPYVVPPNTRSAYETSQAMRQSVAETTRKIIAEDFEWDELVPAPLSLQAAKVLSKIFTRVNPLHVILPKDVDILMDFYPTNIPLKYTVPHIKHEQYWKRCFHENFPSRIEMGITFWKGKYLSACLQHYLEDANPDIFLEDEAEEMARLVAPYISELRLNHLRMVRQPNPPLPQDDVVEDTCVNSVPKLYHHIPLEIVLRRLYNLQEITLIFCVEHLEDQYEPRLFEFTVEDCISLCKGLEFLPYLRILRINRSNLDCIKTKVIAERLIKKECLEELDFTHCKIGDYGMKALSGFLLLHTNLKILRLANNRFREEGVQGIAYALQMKPAAPLELLDLSLNPMSLECATMFAAAFVRCKEKPKTLIVNSCGFTGKSAEKMAGLLSLNRGLTRLDLAANDLSGEAEETLIKAIEMNRNILRIDLRRTNISEKTQAKVDELLKRNAEMLGVEREPSEEIPPLYLNEPEYLIWEYNPNNPDYIPGRYPVRVPEI